MSFQHLHVHSRFSFLDGLNSSEELAKEAYDKGFTSLGLTDHGNISGWIEHYKACKKYDVKPILGIEAYFVDDLYNPKRGEIKYHVCLFPMNDEGIKEIYHLMTEANKHFSFKPRLDLSMLLSLQNVIVTSACGWRGLVSHEHYEGICSRLRDALGDKFYLEIMPLKEDFQTVVNQRVIDLASNSSYPFIATNDAHYVKDTDHEYHNFLLRMNTKGRINNGSEGFYIRTEDEMVNAFQNLCPYLDIRFIREGLAKTQEIVDRIDVKLEAKDIILPKLQQDADKYIRDRCLQRLEHLKEKKGEEAVIPYLERLDQELDVIAKKQFADYFVMVTDFCDFARSNGFEMPIARGSAGGSLTCYLLGITELDPLKYDLLFERFLNYERSDWPDIDLDFQDNRRDEILQYSKAKYGDDRAANISTFTELKPTSAFKDVAKSYDFKITHQMAETVSPLLDNEDTVLQQVKKKSFVRDRIQKLKKWEKIVEYSDAITGCYRQPGRHAAGIVISPEPLEDLGVLEKRGDNYVVNWNMDDAYYQGLVKLDILGLRTLAIIDEAKSLIQERTGEVIDWGDIGDNRKLDTPQVLEWFSKGWTTGCMQFESYLQQKLLRDLEPIKSVNTLIDSNALGRPGPLDSGMAMAYIKGYKEGVLPNAPYQKWISDLTQDTYGVILYQEQIIKILQTLAGYTTAQADILRRVIAKSKGVEEFRKHQEEFVEGCFSASQMPKAVSVKLFNDLGFFSRYSFNKSHAAAYALTALRQMWLKVNYPLEYMCALFRQTEMGKTEKIREFIRECDRLGVEIVNPSINASGEGFSIKGNKLVVGLSSINGVGDKAVNKIITNRNGGAYRSLEDFWIRTRKGIEKTEHVNVGVMKSLTMAGAFSEFGVNQKVFLNQMDWLNNLKDVQHHNRLFDVTPHEIFQPEGDFTEEEKTVNLLRSLPGIAQTDIKIGVDIDEDKLNVLSRVIRGCEACIMRKYYNSPVAPEYDCDNKIMVIGDFPRQIEVKRGRPFMGLLGNRLNHDFARIGLKRRHLYLTNVFKCRPMNNQLSKEVPLTCHGILHKEIDMVKPKLIIAMGNIGMGFFTGQNKGIMKMSSKVENYLIGDSFYPTFHLLHPASVRDEEDEKSRLWKEGLNELKRLIDQAD